MITLELLGLQADGEHLTLNDAEGNRYSLPISDDLRAALRKDIQPTTAPEDARRVSPREIQAMVREGMSVEQICDVASFPAARVSVLAYPIFAEREHLVRSATSMVLGREVGSLTVEELITSRLVARGVPADGIVWDATRKSHHPWVLSAAFTENGEDHLALWRVDLDRKSIEARNADAAALSEKQIEQPHEPQPPANPRIDDVLASLDSQRGHSAPMPTFDEQTEASEPEIAGSHPDGDPTFSQASSPHVLPGESARTAESTPSESAGKRRRTLSVAQPLGDNDFDSSTLEDRAHHPAGSRSNGQQPDTKKKRNNRPEMPSWDEIVFGKKE